MKKLSTLFVTLFICGSIFAQSVPQGIPFQAVARDLQGKVLDTKEINIRINLTTGADGTTVYQEYHQLTTNQLGLFDLVIGKGRATEAAFEDVPWSNQQIWIELAVKDAESDSDYQVLSKSQLLSVPYAMHAGTAGEVQSNEPNSATGPYWKTNGNNGSIPQFNFLGTLDMKDLNFRTANQTRMSILSNGDIDIVNSLSVGEDLSVGRDLFVGRNGDFDNNLNVDGITDLNSTLNVLGISNLNNTLNVQGISNLNNNLNVYGNTLLDATLTVTGTSNLNSQVRITADINAPDGQSDLNNYPLIVSGGSQGVAIQVDDQLAGGALHRESNFLTLFDGSGAPMGRIEGFQAGNDVMAVTDGFNAFTSLFPTPSTAFFNIVDAILDGGSSSNSEQNNIENNTSVDANTQAQLDAVISGATTFNSDFGVGIVSGTLDIANSFIAALADIPGCAILVGCDDLAVGVINLIHSVLQLGLHVGYFSINPGVAFESGGADYAEWLEKADKEEILNYGDVVGVKGGLISKEFENAERFMVVSLNPTVIGAMPQEGKENLFEKIAFMGQVPVKVIGAVSTGDYILPSGNGDGFAIGVSPDAMKANDYSRIIGIAWGEADGEKIYDYVNTAVGINANDLSGMVEQMQLVMNEMQKALRELNPDYQPHFYDVDESAQFANNTSIAPSIDQVIESKINIDNYSREDVLVTLQEIKQDAIAQGLPIDQIPFLSQLLDDPFDEALQTEAKAYWEGIMVRNQFILNNMAKN